MKRVFGLNELESVSKEIVKAAQGLSVWLLNGEMGAGKTTLAKAICRELTVKDMVSSPTFSIVNEYRTSSDQPVFHFDFYRLKNEEEAYDIGVHEYFETGNICLVEWSEKIPSLLPEHFLEIKLEVNDSQSRTIHYGRH
jgi:tRNA threonylcarbamoyladenosine biosynthesis protein TsaE